MKRPALLIFVLALVMILSLDDALVAQSSDSGARPSRRELFTYIWDFVIIGDGEAMPEDLQNIAAYYDGLPQDERTQLEEVMGSPGLSEAQKRQRMRGMWQGIRYGTVATRDGATYRGLLHVQRTEHRNYKDWYYSDASMRLALTEGGDTTVPWAEIVEIEFGADETIVRTNRERLLRGKPATYRVTIHRDGFESVKLLNKEIRTLIFGPLAHVQCAECFRKMEIDWSFCPYDGTSLKTAP